jgi:uncharacterized protein YbaR (Trm112 family)
MRLELEDSLGLDGLCCPICHAPLQRSSGDLVCSSSSSPHHFPVIDSVPVLINESASVFTVEDFRQRRPTTLEIGGGGKLKGLAKRALGNESFAKLKRIKRHVTPTISRNWTGAENYRRLAALLLARTASPKILILGGGVLGEGMEAIVGNPRFEVIETDVSFGPRTKLICDAHDIPYADGYFDAVIAQAVLEHVADPFRCAEEIYRVLRLGGLVYAETPFMQQVHMGPYDFTRFTHLGHRRLFRKFDEVASGAVSGPGMALAWSYTYFLTSFFASKRLRALAESFAIATSFFLKYFDRLLLERKGTFDSASGYYFMGRKGEKTVTDHELVALYRGAG